MADDLLAYPRDGEESADNPSTFIVVDPSVLGQSHLLINTGFIELLGRSYSEIIVLAEKTHCEALSTYLEQEGISTVRYVPYTDRKRICDELYKQLDATGTNAVLFLYLDYRLFAQVNLRRLLGKKFSCYWVLHGHLASLERRTLVDRIKNLIKVSGMFGLFSGNKFIVCGESIRNNFLTHFKKYGTKIFPVFHPIGISPIKAKEPVAPNPNDPISLMFFEGWHPLTPTIEAGIFRLSELARTQGTIRFDIIRNTFSQSANGRLFSNDYGDRVRQIALSDFFLHLPTNTYSLQPSGAIMDMLIAQVPVIGLKTEFAMELAEKIGEFGFFLDSMDDLLNFVANSDKGILLLKKRQFQLNLIRGAQVIKEISARQLSLVGQEFAQQCAVPMQSAVG